MAMGMAHMLEHYMVGHLKQKYIRDHFMVGGSISNSFTNFYLISSTRQLLLDLQIFLSGIFRPEFSDKTIFEYELKAVRNEIAEKKHDIESQIFDVISKKIFLGDCPYRAANNEKNKYFEKFTLHDIQQFYLKDFSTIEPLFVIGGYNINDRLLKEVIILIREFLPQRLHLFNHFNFPKCIPRSFNVEAIKNKNIKSGAYSVFTFPGFSMQDHDFRLRMGLHVLLKILTGSSPFGLSIETRKLGIYNISYKNIMRPRIGIVSLFSFTENNQIFALAKLIKDHIDLLKKDLINEQYISKIVNDAKNKQKAIWENNENKYNWIIDDFKYLKFNINITAEKKILDSITPQFLREIANTIFNWRKFNMFVIYNDINNPQIGKIKKIFQNN
ncbi:insulinase family protein [Candidatus Wolfebacteria bacterium]|nr:insulinase family protein [Candidatus Wolfebacteria bacterium]